MSIEKKTMKRIKQEVDGEGKELPTGRAAEEIQGNLYGDDPAIAHQVISSSQNEGQVDNDAPQILSTAEPMDSAVGAVQDEGTSLRSYKEQVVQLTAENTALKDETEKLQQRIRNLETDQAGLIRTEILIVQQEWEKKLQEAIETELTCSICSEILIQPVTQKCGHLFCSSCITSWFREDQSRQTCPVCRTRWDPNEKVELKAVEGHITQLYSLMSPETRRRRDNVLALRPLAAKLSLMRRVLELLQERRRDIDMENELIEPVEGAGQVLENLNIATPPATNNGQLRDTNDGNPDAPPASDLAPNVPPTMSPSTVEEEPADPARPDPTAAGMRGRGTSRRNRRRRNRN